MSTTMRVASRVTAPRASLERERRNISRGVSRMREAAGSGISRMREAAGGRERESPG